MTGYSYVYILENDDDPARHYTGLTDDLEARLRKHNSGGVPHTRKYCPWHLRVAIAFRGRERAVDFEAYLKSHSGRAFSQKHF